MVQTTTNRIKIVNCNGFQVAYSDGTVVIIKSEVLRVQALAWLKKERSYYERLCNEMQVEFQKALEKSRKIAEEIHRYEEVGGLLSMAKADAARERHAETLGALHNLYELYSSASEKYMRLNTWVEGLSEKRF